MPLTQSRLFNIKNLSIIRPSLPTIWMQSISQIRNIFLHTYIYSLLPNSLHPPSTHFQIFLPLLLPPFNILLIFLNFHNSIYSLTIFLSKIIIYIYIYVLLPTSPFYYLLSLSSSIRITSINNSFLILFPHHGYIDYTKIDLLYNL